MKEETERLNKLVDWYECKLNEIKDIYYVRFKTSLLIQLVTFKMLKRNRNNQLK